jgi:hypothetical protein
MTAFTYYAVATIPERTAMTAPEELADKLIVIISRLVKPDLVSMLRQVEAGERERCARIAETQTEDGLGNLRPQHPLDIAAAIRKEPI